MATFNKGDKLLSVWYAGCECGYKVGFADTVAITVVEVPGHMAMQPWARVELADAPPVLLNLAQMEEVQFLDREGGDDD